MLHKHKTFPNILSDLKNLNNHPMSLNHTLKRVLVIKEKTKETKNGEAEETEATEVDNITTTRRTHKKLSPENLQDTSKILSYLGNIHLPTESQRLQKQDTWKMLQEVKNYLEHFTFELSNLLKRPMDIFDNRVLLQPVHNLSENFKGTFQCIKHCQKA